MKNTGSSRRDFLVKSTGLAGMSWLTLNAPMLMAAAEAATEQRASDSGWVNISPSEAAVLAAVVDQIIPPDKTPGAAEIGVVYFIDQALGDFMAEAAGMLKQGILDLDHSALEAFPRKEGFADLSFKKQTRQLEQIDTTPFFNTMIFLTHCGMFAMPSRGGNRNKAGWDLLGFNNQHAWQPPFGYYDVQAAAEENNRGE
jgi:hypothetical protein